MARPAYQNHAIQRVRSRIITNQKVLKRIEIGKRRLVRILRAHGIANARTLEQKISDAGPSNQRVDPLYLTFARDELIANGVILQQEPAGTPWYYLSETQSQIVASRLSEQLPVYTQLQHPSLIPRIGQALEIAIYKALLTQSTFASYGGFTDLNQHDDSTKYNKHEPPQVVTGKITPGILDFLLRKDGQHVGIEAKNIRPWIYPRDELIKELLKKCCAIDALPVLIARRISYVAFSELFRHCGVVIHQTYNQRFPDSASDLAGKARHKKMLGYHDIRLGNEPDARLIKFLHTDLPAVLPTATARFNEHRDLLESFAYGKISYLAFHTELRLRLGIYQPREEEFPEVDYEEHWY